MPLPPAHGLFGLAVAYTVRPRNVRAHEVCFVLICGLISILPDIDLAVGLVTQNTPWIYHRGPTHSLAAVCLFAIVAAILTRRLRTLTGRERFRLALTYAAVLASHLALDSVWPSKLPMQLYWPFTETGVCGPLFPLVPDFRGLTLLELAIETVWGTCVLFIALALNWKRLGFDVRWQRLTARFAEPETPQPIKAGAAEQTRD